MDAMEVQTYIDLYRKEIYGIRQHKKRILELEYTLLKKILRSLSDLFVLINERKNFEKEWRHRRQPHTYVIAWML